MAKTTRELGDLISIGPAMLRDFELLGIRSVKQLAGQNPQRMYARLNRVSGQRQDACVLDVFCAAVAQARNPRLPAEECQWWYWSRKRKGEEKSTVHSSQSTVRGEEVFPISKEHGAHRVLRNAESEWRSRMGI